nr:hypothetical protein [Anaerotruncus massiliensis (ex Togo et al. 2019)]
MPLPATVSTGSRQETNPNAWSIELAGISFWKGSSPRSACTRLIEPV